MNLRTADNQWWRTDDGKTFLPTSDDTFMDWTAWVGDEPATTLLLPPAAESELSAVLARAPHAGSELSSMQMDTPLSVVVTWTRGTTLALTRYPATQVEPHESAGFHIPVVVATDHISGTPSAAAGSTGGALAAYVQTTPSGRSIAVRTVSYDRECTVAARESAVPASGTPGPPIIR